MNNAAAPTHKQTLLPVAAMLAAGAIHLLIAPQHMAHAPAHGLFFGFAGLMQIGWAFEFRHTPSRQMVQAGMAMSGRDGPAVGADPGPGRAIFHKPRPNRVERHRQ